jgi:hypothetical protein
MLFPKEINGQLIQFLLIKLFIIEFSDIGTDSHKMFKTKVATFVTRVSVLVVFTLTPLKMDFELSSLERRT